MRFEFCFGFFVLMMAGCFPSDPGCLYDSACGDLDPERDNARLCINFCAPLPSARELQFERATCLLDPCDETPVVPPVNFRGPYVCPDAHACERGPQDADLPAALGICRPVLTQLFDSCNVFPDPRFPERDLGPQCQQGNFCAHPSSPRVQAVRDLTGGTYATGVCLTPIKEGGHCDSNFADPDHLDSETGEVGDSPCEFGTYCLSPNELFGAGPLERRCVRTCGGPTGDVPSSAYCACDQADCVVLEDRLNAPGVGDIGEAFCAPCLASGVRCEGVLQCCEAQAECTQQQAIFEDAPAPDTVCCWPEGTACTATSSGRCCQGTSCFGQGDNSVCQQCGVEGQPAPEAGCCDGLEVTIMGQQAICTRCGDACSDEYFVLYGDSGAENVVIPDARRSYRAVEQHAVGGDLRGSLTLQSVDYRLTQDHRAYILGGNLQNGFRANETGLPVLDASYLALPPDRLARSENIEEGPWESVRVYDQGACSGLLTWSLFSRQLVQSALSEVATEVQTLGGNLRHIRTNIAPFLQSTARLPAEATLGLSDTRDGFTIDSEFHVELDNACGETQLQVRVSLVPVLLPGFNTTGETNRADADALSVACRRNDAQGAFNCRLLHDFDGAVRAIGRTDGSDRRNTFAYGVEPSQHDSRIARVGCRIDRDLYRCYQPFGDHFITRFGYETLPRPVDYVAGAKDISFIIQDIEVDIDDCWPGELLFEDNVAAQLRTALHGFDSSAGALLSSILGSSLSQSFGVDPHDLQPCAGGDARCRERPFLGNRRLSCQPAWTTRPATGEPVIRYLCDGFRIEPRRINIRPEGIEFVLAEDPGDPQYALLEGRSYFGLGEVCRPARYDTTVRDRPTPSVMTVQSAPFQLLGRVCDNDELDCRAICPSVGTPCSDAPLFGVTVPPRSQCQNGQCCPSDSVCDGACRDLSRDNLHCGECDNACDTETEACMEGRCFAL